MNYLQFYKIKQTNKNKCRRLCGTLFYVKVPDFFSYMAHESKSRPQLVKKIFKYCCITRAIMGLWLLNVGNTYGRFEKYC